MALALMGATSCGVTKTIRQLSNVAQDSSIDKDESMYFWEEKITGYGVSYDTYLANYYNTGDITDLLKCYKSITVNSKEEAGSKKVAPGICAEMAYLLMKPDVQSKLEKLVSDGTITVKDDIKNTEYVDLAKDFLALEYEYYPESKAIYEPLFKDILK